jgi:hypothetical protein
MIAIALAGPIPRSETANAARVSLCHLLTLAKPPARGASTVPEDQPPGPGGTPSVAGDQRGGTLGVVISILGQFNDDRMPIQIVDR